MKVYTRTSRNTGVGMGPLAWLIVTCLVAALVVAAWAAAIGAVVLFTIGRLAKPHLDHTIDRIIARHRGVPVEDVTDAIEGRRPMFNESGYYQGPPT